MRVLSCVFLVVMLFGCNKKENDPKIEIYLLKHPVASTEGILFRETVEYKHLDSTEKEWYKDNRIDTITGKFIYGGKFEVIAGDVQSVPFINDDEIHSFDIQKHIITFDSVVIKRIAAYRPPKSQFVVTINKKPVLMGYFWTGFTSHNPNWYSLWGSDAYNLDGKNKKQKSLILEFGAPKIVRDQREQRASYNKKRPPYNPELIEAFSKSDRLIE